MKKTATQAVFRIWNEAQCEKVMEAVYRVLEETGCEIKNEAACKMLKEAGCTVEGSRVRIPRALMEKAVESAPKSIDIFDLSGSLAMKLDTEHIYYGPPISTVFVRDVNTGEKRNGTRQDARNAGLICEALNNVSWASAMNGISDGVSGLGDVYEVYELLRSTRKPLMYWAGCMENLRTEFAMFEAVAGGKKDLEEKPCAICLICPMDPLTHTDDSIEQLMYLAGRNAVPVYISGVSLGCTSPITIAGSVVVGIADSLVGLLVSQLTHEGAPFIVSRFCDTMNMRTITIERSHPEMVLANAATGDVFKYLGLPFCVNLGDTDSTVFDQAAAFDTAMSLYTGTLSGATMNMSMGGFESANMTDYIGTVYGNEVIEYIKCIVQGAEVTDETLALEDIDEVGPGGNFLMMEDTFEKYRDFWQPDIMTATTLSRAGTDPQSIEGKYRKRINEIIERGPQNPLPDEILEKLDGILKEAEERA